jgi:sugar lactone lactonase YvrE
MERVVLEGLHLPECPRWHEDDLWLVDMWAHEVLRLGPSGVREVVHRFPDDEDPGGIGWLPDDTLLVVGMEGRVVHRIEGGRATAHADLRDLAEFQLNDMVVGPDGTAWVSQFGWDMWGGGPYADTVLIRVDADGTATVAAEEMAVPNGMALSEDGTTLTVAEPGAGRLSTFTVDGDRLVDRRTTPLEKATDAPYVTPDGICLDEEGAIWAADPMGHRVVRVLDGTITDELPVPDAHPLACVLGGHDRRTIYVCTSQEHHKPTRTGTPTGQVLSFGAAVPGEGRP